MKTDIKISVVMPVYNGEVYLHEAISSILNQTEKDFEFIIVDDGSTDGTEEIIKSFSDPRIRLYKKDHEGLISTLNFGVAQSYGEYIARMDADDIAMPERLSVQFAYMKVHNLAVCGSFAETIDETGKKIGSMQYPPRAKEIPPFTLVHNPFIHSSVMMRRDIFQNVGGYKNFFRHIEDYELWTRIIFKYKTDNIPEILLQYRIHSGQITSTKLFELRMRGIIVRMLALWRFLFRF